MFEDYLIDSYSFYLEGNSCIESRKAKRYFRASIFYAASSIEAFANYLADTFNQGNSLTQFEIAFLLDKKIIFDNEKIEVKQRIEYHRIDDKLKILIKKFVKEFDFTSKDWSHFMEFKKFRDRLVHPHDSEDEIQIKEYKNIIKRGLSSIINIMNTISNGIFRKPLRKQLLDLIP